MKLKNLLRKYDGEFKIYRHVMGDEDVLLANENTPTKEMKKLGRKRIDHFFVADCVLEIYVK